MMSRVAIVLLLIVLSAGCRGQQQQSTSSKAGVPYVDIIFRAAHLSGSLEYWGRCEENPLPDFPEMHAPDKNAESAVYALREVFSADPRMRVTQEPSGTIRMVETNVPKDLLDFKISEISFTHDYEGREAVYDGRSALLVIFNTPDVKAFANAQGIVPPDISVQHRLFESVSVLEDYPESLTRPHISGDLHNVTVSQALDYVLRTFPGLWIYENCPSKKGKRAVFVTFFANGPA